MVGMGLRDSRGWYGVRNSRGWYGFLSSHFSIIVIQRSNNSFPYALSMYIIIRHHSLFEVVIHELDNKVLVKVVSLYK